VSPIDFDHILEVLGKRGGGRRQRKKRERKEKKEKKREKGKKGEKKEKEKKTPSCKYSMTNIHQHLVAAHAATTTVVARLCVVAVVHSSCTVVLIGFCKKWHHMGKKNTTLK